MKKKLPLVTTSLMETMWSEIQLILGEKLSPWQRKVWLEPLTAIVTPERLSVFAPSQYMADFIKTRFGAALQEAAHHLISPDCMLSVLCRSLAEPVAAKTTASESAACAQPKPGIRAHNAASLVVDAGSDDISTLSSPSPSVARVGLSTKAAASSCVAGAEKKRTRKPAKSSAKSSVTKTKSGKTSSLPIPSFEEPASDEAFAILASKRKRSSKTEGVNATPKKRVRKASAAKKEQDTTPALSGEKKVTRRSKNVSAKTSGKNTTQKATFGKNIVEAQAATMRSSAAVSVPIFAPAATAFQTPSAVQAPVPAATAVQTSRSVQAPAVEQPSALFLGNASSARPRLEPSSSSLEKVALKSASPRPLLVSEPPHASPVASLKKSLPESAKRALPNAGTEQGKGSAVSPSPRPLSAVQMGLPFSLPEVSKKTEDLKKWRHSFEDFVIGPCNELAYAASRSMTGEALATDVLYLSSAPGLGKTHLMQAVGKSLYEKCNRVTPKVEYLTAEEFASGFYLALKSQQTDKFKARYRNLDLLLLEDVHFFQGKEKMQMELLATIKALSDKGSKVIFTSSFLPRDLGSMDDQLLSRLGSGFVSAIDRPDFDTRKRIFHQKAAQYQVILPQDVNEMLAQHIRSDVRQIESCLRNLILKARLFNSAITMQMAWEAICQYADQSPILDIDGIINFVCKGFNISREQLVSTRRKQEYVCARNAAFFLARKHTDLSLQAIGQHFNRKHSTVLKGITNIEREMARETPLGRQIVSTLNMIEKNGNIVPLL